MRFKCYNLSAFINTKGIKHFIECLESKTQTKAIEIVGVSRNRKTYCHEIIYYLVAKKNNIPHRLTDDNARLYNEIKDMPRKNKHKSFYILENSRAGLIKVGVSKNIDKRMKVIQNATGCKIIKVAEIEVDNAENLESIILVEFNEYSTFGEWLDIQCKDRVLQYIKEVYK